MLTGGICKECETAGSRPLSSLTLDFLHDPRVSSLVCLAVKIIIEKATPLPPNGMEEQHTVSFRADGSLARIFGGEDAGLSIHAGSKFWTVLACLGQELKDKADASLETVCSHQQVSTGRGIIGGCPIRQEHPDGQAGDQQGSEACSILAGSQGLSSVDFAEAAAPSTCHFPCSILAMRISWGEPLSPAVVHVCGSLLRCWFPAHAAATRPCWAPATLSALSNANRLAGPAAVLGHRERWLVEQVLRQSGGAAEAKERKSGGGLGPLLGLLEAAEDGAFTQRLLPLMTSPRGGLGNAEPSGGLLAGRLAQEQGAAVLASLPYCWKVEWQSFGRSDWQGQALVTLTNGA